MDKNELLEQIDSVEKRILELKNSLLKGETLSLELTGELLQLAGRLNSLALEIQLQNPEALQLLVKELPIEKRKLELRQQKILEVYNVQ